MLFDYENTSSTIFATCRLNGLKNHNNLNNIINYTHSTKEVIQMIKFLKGELIIPKPYNRYCFRTALMDKTYIDYNSCFNKVFNNSSKFVIEICSRKKYIHNNFYLHHLAVDDRFEWFRNTPKEIIDNRIIEIQSDEEIENDILEIQKMLYPKKIIIVSHYNSKLNGKYINSRNNLINLLDNICQKHSIHFINPTKILTDFTQIQVMTRDLGHYTDFGLKEFSNRLNKLIE